MLANVKQTGSQSMPRWEEATVDEKLEMLRADLNDVSQRHNMLALRVVDDAKRLEARLSAIEEKLPKT
jgi:hypothetical protein